MVMISRDKLTSLFHNIYRLSISAQPQPGKTSGDTALFHAYCADCSSLSYAMRHHSLRF